MAEIPNIPISGGKVPSGPPSTPKPKTPKTPAPNGAPKNPSTGASPDAGGARSTRRFDPDLDKPQHGAPAPAPPAGPSTIKKLGMARDLANGKPSKELNEAISNRMDGTKDKNPDGVKATAKNVGMGAAKGAAGATTATKLAGGGLQGAAIGAAEGAIKSKTGRRILFLALFSQPIMIALVILAMMAGLMGAMGAVQAARQELTDTAATLSGMDTKDVDAIEEIAGERGVPWEIIGAIEYVQKTTPNPEGIGKQGIDKEPLEAGDFKDEGIADDKDAEDDKKARVFMANRLALEMAKSKYDTSEYPLASGAKFDEESASGPTQYIDTDDKDSSKAAERAKALYLPAIEALPLAGNKEVAPEIYEIALQWALGQQICGTNQSVFVGGEWTSPVEMIMFTSRWGPRGINPATGLGSAGHSGDDLAASSGTPVYAASSGVAKVMPNTGKWYGNGIEIDHGGGYKTMYAHMLAGSLKPANGATVKVGQQIGQVGSTGNSSGPHLHFEVMVPTNYTGATHKYFGYLTADPNAFMADRGVKLGSKPGTGTGTGTDLPASDPSDLGDPNQAADSPIPTVDGGTIGVTFTGPYQGKTHTINKDQIGNAKAIIGVGRQLGINDKGLAIAIMTTMVESHMVNVNYGDRDSLGLFQQRAGWGSKTERTTPAYSASAFFGGPTGPNHGSPPGLLDTTGWETMPMGDAAQKVQVSAFPDRYAEWEEFAKKLVAAIGGTTLNTGCSGATQGLRISTYNVCSVVEPCNSTLRAWNTRVKDIVKSTLRVSPDVAIFQEMSRSNRIAPLTSGLKAGGYTLAGKYKSELIYAKNTTVTSTSATGAKLQGGGIDFKARPGGSRRFGVFQVMRSLSSGSQFLAVGYHTSASATAAKNNDRKAEIEDLFKTIAPVRTKNSGIPVVIAGDINSYGRKYRIKYRDLADKTFESHQMTSAEDLALTKTNFNYDSYNGFRTQKTNGKNSWHMDHIYLPNGTPVTQWGLELNTGRKPSQFEADHNMVWADVSLGGSVTATAAAS